MFKIIITLLSFTFATSYNIVPQKQYLKPSIYFFPAYLKNQIPREFYGDFLNSLEKIYHVNTFNENIDIHELNQEINEMNKEVTFISHSSGANKLLHTYNKLNITNKKPNLILIEPIEFNKMSLNFQNHKLEELNKINFNMDSLDDSIQNIFQENHFDNIKENIKENIQSIFNKETIDNENNTTKPVNNTNILIIEHKTSSKWRFIPLVPPINLLKKDLSFLKNVNLKTEIIKDYSHFDALDGPWAKQLNKIFFIKNQNKESYSKNIIPIIQNFNHK